MKVWVPAGISRAVMHRTGSLHVRGEVWAHASLVDDDGSKMKMFEIEVFDQIGGMISIEGVQPMTKIGSIPSALSIAPRVGRSHCANDVGIIARHE